MSDFRFQPWPETIAITTLLEFCSWLMIYYNRVIKMAFRYKFSEEEIKETEQARKKNKDKRAEARLKALEVRAKGAEARLSAFSEQL